jgi:hypothetical protein
MIKSSIEKLSETIGFEIGASDDVTQANLINGLCKGLANSMDDHKLDLQLCFIADKLDSKSSKVLKSLVAFIELKEK